MMAAEMILEVQGLSKSYRNVQAVKELSLQIRKGDVYGLLGPNGSGKTTTLAMLMGILHPTKGSFSWFGNGQEDANRLRIGCLLETPNFYSYLNAFENLRVTAVIKKMTKPEERIREVLEQVDLLERGTRPFRTYSLGMKQRLAVASALLSDPEVLVLDEPTNGLDPRGIAEMRELITRIAAQGKTIILASHILDEVQKICSHVAILKSGTIIFDGTMDEIMRQGTTLKVSAEDIPGLAKTLQEMEGIRIIPDPDEKTLLLDTEIPAAEINRRLVDKGIYLSELYPHKKSLETIFLERTEA